MSPSPTMIRVGASMLCSLLRGVRSGLGLPSRPAGRRAPQPVASLRARLLEGSPGPRGRRGSSASPPHPSRRAPRPGPTHWDRERRANPSTSAAFASQGLWLRRHSTSGRNPRPSSLPETSLSSLWECRSCDIAARLMRATLWVRTRLVNAVQPHVRAVLWTLKRDS
jgi:hypothetical protein